MMEELTTTTNDSEYFFEYLKYSINLPFHFTIIGQTDSGNTHSIVS